MGLTTLAGHYDGRVSLVGDGRPKRGLGSPEGAPDRHPESGPARRGALNRGPLPALPESRGRGPDRRRPRPMSLVGKRPEGSRRHEQARPHRWTFGRRSTDLRHGRKRQGTPLSHRDRPCPGRPAVGGDGPAVTRRRILPVLPARAGHPRRHQEPNLVGRGGRRLQRRRPWLVDQRSQPPARPPSKGGIGPANNSPTTWFACGSWAPTRMERRESHLRCGRSARCLLGGRVTRSSWPPRRIA